MIALFDRLSALGFIFSHSAQREVADGDQHNSFDANDPLWEKVDRVIPALAAAKEARALEEALRSPSCPPPSDASLAHPSIPRPLIAADPSSAAGPAQPLASESVSDRLPRRL